MVKPMLQVVANRFLGRLEDALRQSRLWVDLVWIGRTAYDESSNRHDRDGTIPLG
jgi:hypothetical protein